MPLGGRATVSIIAISAIGFVAFGWPLLADPESQIVAHSVDGSWLFALMIPLLLVAALTQIADGTLSAKSVAMLGVLSAVVAALRPIGAGVAGLEPVWVVLVLGAAALGPGFGFLLGAISMFASALVTGGVGPWLPFQMIGAAWVGLVSGFVGMRLREGSRSEVFTLAAVGAVCAVLYGWLLNMWFWPFTGSLPPGLAFDPGAALSENLRHWMSFNLATSLGYDIPRAVLTVVLILAVGRPVLLALRRSGRRASFAVAGVPESSP